MTTRVDVSLLHGDGAALLGAGDSLFQPGRVDVFGVDGKLFQREAEVSLIDESLARRVGIYTAVVDWSLRGAIFAAIEDGSLFH